MMDDVLPPKEAASSIPEVSLEERWNFVIRRLGVKDRKEVAELISGLALSDHELRLVHVLKDLKKFPQTEMADGDQVCGTAFGVERFQFDGGPELCGVMGLAELPYRNKAEFSIIVAPQYRNRGLGYSMIQYLIAYAQYQGLKKITASVADSNKAMLKICRRLGFIIKTDRNNVSTNVVALML